MSREKRYVFKMMLTDHQKRIIQDVWDDCVGVSSGEGMIATVSLADGSTTMTIIPWTEKEILEPHLKAMRDRTDVDNIGLIG